MTLPLEDLLQRWPDATIAEVEPGRVYVLVISGAVSSVEMRHLERNLHGRGLNVFVLNAPDPGTINIFEIQTKASALAAVTEPTDETL